MTIKDPFFKSVEDDKTSRKRKRERSSRIKSTTKGTNGEKIRSKNFRSNDKSNKNNNKGTIRKGKSKASRSKEDDDEDEEIRIGSNNDDDDDEDDGLSDDFDKSSDELGIESDDEDQDFKDETPAQKRLRLAQNYLDGLKQNQINEEGTFDAAEIDKEIIASRLQRDVLESTGKLYTFIGAQLKSQTSNKDSSFVCFKTGKNNHRLPITCVKLNKDGSNLYVADKQGRIIKYDCKGAWDSFKSSTPEKTLNQSNLIKPIRMMKNHSPPKQSSDDKFKKKEQSKQHKTLSNATPGEQKGHLGEILTIDITEDEKILASGGKDKLIGVWDLTDDNGQEWKVGLRGHKDSIASISFRIGTPTLYTSSFDRMIKVFNLDSLTYSETLFGHQDKIHSISSLRNEVLVSAGGRDRTCRYWKIIDESQLVFRGGGSSKVRDLIDGVGFDPDDEPMKPESLNKKNNKKTSNPNGIDEKSFTEGSIDCVCMVDDKLFLSGGDSGSISLWTTSKKKAIFNQYLAHGTERVTVTGSSEEVLIQPRWITSLYCIPYSDTFMSGSWDGSLKVWRLTSKDEGLLTGTGGGGGGGDIKKFEFVCEIDLSLNGGFINSIHAVFRSNDNPGPNHVSIKPKRTDDDEEKEKSGEGSKKIGTDLVIAIGIGQEHRLGRWKKIPKAKNQTVLALISL